MCILLCLYCLYCSVLSCRTGTLKMSIIIIIILSCDLQLVCCTSTTILDQYCDGDKVNVSDHCYNFDVFWPYSYGWNYKDKWQQQLVTLVIVAVLVLVQYFTTITSEYYTIVPSKHTKGLKWRWQYKTMQIFIAIVFSGLTQTDNVLTNDEMEQIWKLGLLLKLAFGSYL